LRFGLRTDAAFNPISSSIGVLRAQFAYQPRPASYQAAAGHLDVVDDRLVDITVSQSGLGNKWTHLLVIDLAYAEVDGELHLVRVNERDPSGTATLTLADFDYASYFDMFI